jgi:hypothetical protein
VLQKPEDLTDAIACAVLEEWQTAPIEIQQQMQDNINGSKAHKKINYRFTSPNIC